MLGHTRLKGKRAPSGAAQRPGLKRSLSLGKLKRALSRGELSRELSRSGSFSNWAVDVPAAQALLTGLREMRAERLLCDVALVAGEKSFPAHQAVLAAASEPLRELFVGGSEAGGEALPAPPAAMRLQLQGLGEPEVVEALLDHVYQGATSASLGKDPHGLRGLSAALAMPSLDPRGAPANAKEGGQVAAIVLLVDVALVTATIVLDRTSHREPPAGGATDSSAAIGWLGVLSAIIIFGCYGVLIKTPAIVQANVDAMIFTLYYGFATAFVSMLIWAIAGSHAGLTLTGGSFAMGALFGLFWTTSQLCAYIGVQTLGYAVGPAIWIGITICVSFVWGTLVFGNPVPNLPGAILALALLLVGVCLAAASSRLSDIRQQRAQQQRELDMQLTGPEGCAEGVRKSLESGGIRCEPRHRVCQGEARIASEAPPEVEEDGTEDKCHGSGRGSAGGGGVLFGLLNCVGVGVFNGSLMVPMRCFQQGCSSIGISAFDGDILAPLAFLPSLALGIVTVLPVSFALYFWRTLLARRLPNFHFSVVALPGFLTGMFWGMGNFNAMFATVYLGQTIGYPLTQCCLILNGLWGILYYKEIKGAQPIGLFALASLIIIAGAALDGMYG